MDYLLHVGASNAAAAVVLALLVAGLGLFIRRPALMHALWLLVPLKLLAPPLYSVDLSWPLGRNLMPEMLRKTAVGLEPTKSGLLKHLRGMPATTGNTASEMPPVGRNANDHLTASEDLASAELGTQSES